ncbi:MAG: hypothetical protein A3J09_02430 [Candidatus Zambryskibacteria bacterium RIFCSPLOWO2_02_FULL_51_21]|uniref:Uncharacterized protein n=1 Tax=Candidatus Zambryskibacteria bacterium RIFCSPHIGHO2_02_FULL_43_37 TaxID=1802749 RepID=A0A1G2TGD3_9BACT|nr:MAG: hypothetical protein A2723_02425 [Candidatus Zambryskibacteria bacterium RIFCSPHIGHO2_01_FULL_52_18]OHA96355.1 MAG: hypothetical protein A3D49_00475 [Candidatus Zambryskibacteria bacterium RIFCSPHIGHO2_02_FULL_43_37]OHB07756.1 MAG: hypothetical protein A2944_00340 [Candidatus Zambryskibacteria bacterium RIFCSPLOWO2_01_FULL_52_12]OHB11386.1 MAG: hypothetical protein A3J09_02430 [Candidatus Zambryskibacteria bacterium RIFCSPLOWO2_02_FULL_51_21]
MNEQDKLIQEQFQKLPLALQKALGEIPWKSLVNEIARLHNLKPEQVESIETETMFILYGFESPDDYVSNMVRETGIAEDLAYVIANEVNEKIFKPVSVKVEEAGKQQPTSTSIPELKPENLPMVEKGEMVHEVPHVEAPNPKSQIPNNIEIPKEEKPPIQPAKSAYVGSQDPYREPLS